MIRFAWCIAVLVAFLCPLPAKAEIYKYVSVSGEILLVDYQLKAEEMQARGLKLVGTEASTPPKQDPVQAQEAAERENQLQMEKIRAAESAESGVTAAPTSFGSVRIDQTAPRDGWTQIQVTYKNDTTNTFTSSVGIRCQAFKDGKIVAGATTQLSARELGVIAPGFEVPKEISVSHTIVNHADEIKCEVVEGR